MTICDVESSYLSVHILKANTMAGVGKVLQFFSRVLVTDLSDTVIVNYIEC